MKEKICIICGDNIGDSPKRMIPIEQPYMNLWTHKDCKANFTDDWKEFLEKYIKTLIK